MKHRYIAQILFVLSVVYLAVTPQVTSAEDVFTIVVKKHEAKKNTRWSLAEWLETRDRMRLMDLWLAIHSPSPFEFFLGGDFTAAARNSQEPPVDESYFSGRGAFAAYASIFGLQGEYDSDAHRWSTLFNLRVFGYHAQGTNITLQGGIRFQAEPDTTRAWLLGVSTNFYLARFFGIEALYRYVFPSIRSKNIGVRVSGHRVEAGLFIDFKMFRVYGDYFIEKEFRRESPLLSHLDRQGAIVGGKFFF